MAIFLDSSYWQLYTYLLFFFIWLYIKMMCRFNSWISAILFLMYIRNTTAWCTATAFVQLQGLFDVATSTSCKCFDDWATGGTSISNGGESEAWKINWCCICFIFPVYICLHKSDDFLVRSTILLMEAILHHLGCMKRYEYWDICHISSCRISSISSNVRDITLMLYLLGCMLAVFTWKCFLVNHHIIFFKQLVATADQ